MCVKKVRLFESYGPKAHHGFQIFPRLTILQIESRSNKYLNFKNENIASFGEGKCENWAIVALIWRPHWNVLGASVKGGCVCVEIEKKIFLPSL